ncbi:MULTISPECIES: Ger(x)C family spore germination protein [unclassified Paenibacillus]|uniref:Ger(x)C family spore germination protein n=1 Tax=unclassified Paenibacillus TaxID=185978 RepID=UPI000955D787|nr:MULTISPECIES: Ger(x)C family spore germination protein [unclassified Paenibacillus]ASS64983.2 Ger(x)C family spore germination protein [Paenibacillus sp. RUD330]SIQ52407.1 germination protein, Ger(x)C family [Paenibacillus sp. RU4X]SIQ74895.1 germination protein, Ger(x)C family [Paenibacillus sp. RU4T]
MSGSKGLRAAAACCLLGLLSGCWDSKDVDNRLMMGAMGLEKGSGQSLNVWMRFPLPKTAQSTEGKDFYAMSQSGLTVADAINQARYKLPKSLDASSTRALLLDESMAHYGLKSYLEFAVRERSVPLDAVVAVVKGKMSRIFTSPNPTGEFSGIYTKLFFEPYAGGIPRKNKTMLWEIYSKLYNPLQANLIPILREGTQNSFELDGNAIFAKDRMVGELTKDESLIYEIITHRFHDSEVKLMSRSDVKIVHNRTRVNTELSNGRPLIRVDSSLIVTLVDSSQMNEMTEREVIRELQEDLELQAKSMFAKTQKAGADIFGFGNRFRSRLQPYQYEEWPERYRSAKISMKFHIDLRNTGLEFLE